MLMARILKALWGFPLWPTSIRCHGLPDTLQGKCGLHSLTSGSTWLCLTWFESLCEPIRFNSTLTPINGIDVSHMEQVWNILKHFFMKYLTFMEPHMKLIWLVNVCVPTLALTPASSLTLSLAISPQVPWCKINTVTHSSFSLTASSGWGLTIRQSSAPRKPVRIKGSIVGCAEYYISYYGIIVTILALLAPLMRRCLDDGGQETQ